MRFSFKLVAVSALLIASSFAVAGSKGSMNNGLMEVGVTFLYPPTPAQLNAVKQQIQRASAILCDATDGQIRINKAWLMEGGGSEDQGDIWVWPQGGRSGLSFYFNGSGLGTAGTHINLYQDGIFGDIIAHELGHLAFGLGDQYDEQSRFGGPCGIGPGFDSGIDEQNHSIMQQSGYQRCATPDAAHPGLFVAAGNRCATDADCGAGQSCQVVIMSELNVASNFDPLRGDNNGCKAGCTDSNCNTNWNSGTSRFEATQQFLIHAKSDWETLKENYPFVTLPVGLPNAVPPAVCSTAVIFDERVVGTDQVMLIIDRSGSMDAPIAVGSTDTRLDFAKAAARAFVQLQGASGTSDVGQVSFNSTPTLDRSLGLLAPGDINNFIMNDIDTLTAGGTTAIGDALLSTQFQFQAVATAGRVRTAFLLSDGENNAGSNPRDAAQSLKNQGVRVFTIPVGDEADRALMSDLAGTTGGAMLEGDNGQPLPAIYTELAAKIGGYPLLLPRQIQYARPNGKARQLSSQIDVPVGSTQLVIMLSSKMPNVSQWQISTWLKDPSNNYYYESTMKDLVVDPFFKIIRVANPEPGQWVVGADSTNGSTVSSYLVVYAKNPSTKCSAGVSSFVVNPGQKATVLANAQFGGELMSGVTFSAEVVSPTGVSVPMSLVRDAASGAVSGQFNSFSGRGIYAVNVQCQVSASAKQLPGEILTGPPNVYPPVQPFTASATTYFFYNGPTQPKCVDESDNGDCDNDGISNGREPDGDLDGDGLPNRYDSDANGDDIPDSEQGIEKAFILPSWYVPPGKMYPGTTSTTTSTTGSGSTSGRTSAAGSTNVSIWLVAAAAAMAIVGAQ